MNTYFIAGNHTTNYRTEHKRDIGRRLILIQVCYIYIRFAFTRSTITVNITFCLYFDFPCYPFHSIVNQFFAPIHNLIIVSVQCVYKAYITDSIFSLIHDFFKETIYEYNRQFICK